MATIMIYRRTDCEPVKLTPAQVKKAAADIKKKGARVERPSLVKFLLGGLFSKLKVTPQSIIDSPVQRAAQGKGWEVPSDSLGRKGAATASQAESIRLWVKQNLTAYGIDPDSVSVVLEER